MCRTVPELPEVETIVRSLAPRLAGRRITGVEFRSPLVCQRCAPGTPERVAGALIEDISRHGKYIVVRCDRGVLTIHLRMTGKLLVDTTPGPYARAVFHLSDGNLVFDDVRQFGTVEWTDALPERVERLGPDPTLISLPEFCRRLHGRRGRTKPLLLNQEFLRGLGNIYVDEALFRAGVHPRTLVGRLGPARAGRLHAAIQEVLAEAIALRGSSVSDYVDAQGERGGFQMRHRVYGKEGEPCLRCGTPIRRIVVAQRGTHYCPRCQRA